MMTTDKSNYGTPLSYATLSQDNEITFTDYSGFVFAVNSSVHSYLILAFGSADRITRDVGFYYMANAAGRLLGTLLSGLSFQIGGLPLCLATAGVMAALSWLAARRLGAA